MRVAGERCADPEGFEPDPPFPFELETDQYEQRARQAGESGEFGATFYTSLDDRRHSYAALHPAAEHAGQQLELALAGYDERAAIRRALADKIASYTAHVCEPWIHRLPEKLRRARLSGQWGVRLETGLPVVFWDAKAGLSRLCPDDAREEAMRLRRRVEPAMRAAQLSGARLTYAVFTMPNAAPGKLRAGMDAIFQRFRRLMRSGDFPQIEGSLAVLEAPLGARRDWNVHLNVIFVHRGFVDWGKLRRAWHWNVELRLLPSAPGAIGAALAELIKYVVAATLSKSQDKADAGATRAPPMLDWESAELLEWLRAFHGFRRTRGYGSLYGLKTPDPDPLGPVVWLGSVSLQCGRYVRRAPLLDSIPEDKSLPPGPGTYLERLYRTLAPGGIAGFAAEMDRATAKVPFVKLV